MALDDMCTYGAVVLLQKRDRPLVVPNEIGLRLSSH